MFSRTVCRPFSTCRKFGSSFQAQRKSFNSLPMAFALHYEACNKYRKGSHMKIVVTGGSGLIGKKLVKHLRQQGHEVVAASPSSGVNTLTGEGLAGAVRWAQGGGGLTHSAPIGGREGLE